MKNATRLQRLLAITIMLINRRKVTAGELAEHFDVSIRTIYRDIAAIQAAGIPVTSYQGYEGGFHIIRPPDLWDFAMEPS